MSREHIQDIPPRLTEEPWYLPLGNEVAVFEQCHARRLPVMLKGPTGCGKTRFVEHMAYRLGRPLITVACHEDMTASDLVGRYLLEPEGTVWHDGPLTRAVKEGECHERETRLRHVDPDNTIPDVRDVRHRRCQAQRAPHSRGTSWGSEPRPQQHAPARERG